MASLDPDSFEAADLISLFVPFSLAVCGTNSGRMVEGPEAGICVVRMSSEAKTNVFLVRRAGRGVVGSLAAKAYWRRIVKEPDTGLLPLGC